MIAASPHVTIDTPRLQGSIDLKGGRIDDLSLTQYREDVDPNSPPIVLFSPSGAPDAYYAEFGWVPAAGTTAAMPGPDTVWKQDGSGTLGVDHPVTLSYDNGQGLIFTRTIAVDDHYLFTIKDQVANKGGAPVTLFPYGLISRHGTPPVLGYYILHEGPIGMMGADGEKEETYKKIAEIKSESWDVTDAWLGFTDKYWAAVLLPEHRRQGEDPLLRHQRQRQGHLSDRLSRRRRRPWRRARPCPPTRGCSPAPRKSPSSASISRSDPAATTRRSISTISIC